MKFKKIFIVFLLLLCMPVFTFAEEVVQSEDTVVYTTEVNDNQQQPENFENDVIIDDSYQENDEEIVDVTEEKILGTDRIKKPETFGQLIYLIIIIIVVFIELVVVHLYLAKTIKRFYKLSKNTSVKQNVKGRNA